MQVPEPVLRAGRAYLTVKKAVARSWEMRVSVSRRTISGSFKPALANSCSADGIVAENNNVCRNRHDFVGQQT